MEIILSSLFVLVIYLRTMYRGVPGGDSGELLAEACQLGTVHPPGYPLLTIMLHFAINYIPFYENAAQKAHCLSCVMGATTCFIMGTTVHLYSKWYLTNSPFESLSALCGVVFALSPLTWEYTVGAEVFALNNLLCSVILYLTVKIAVGEDKNEKELLGFLGAFISGMALANQHTSLLYELILVPYVLSMLFRSGSMTNTYFLLITIAFLFGLSPYLYLYLASLLKRPGSWGDMTTFVGFVRHVSRAEYGSMRLSPRIGNDTFIAKVLAYIVNANQQFTFVGLLMFCFGVNEVIHVEIKNKLIRDDNGKTHSLQKPIHKVGCVLLVTLGFYTFIWNAVFSNLPLDLPMAAAVNSRFYMQPNIVVSCFMGIGAQGILKRCRIDAASKAAMLKAFAVIVVAALSQRHNHWNEGKLVEQYGQAIIDTIPPDSLLLSHTDIDWNSVRYLRVCEKQAPEIVHLSLQLIPYPWFRQQITEGLYGKTVFPELPSDVSTERLSEQNAVLITSIIEDNFKAGLFSGGIYLDMQAVNDIEIDRSNYRGFTILPWGPVYRVFPKMNSFELEEHFSLSSKKVVKARGTMKPLMNEAHPYGSWENAIHEIMTNMQYQLSIMRLSHALSLNIDHDQTKFVSYLKHLRLSSKGLWEIFHQKMGGSGANHVDPYALTKNVALSFIRYCEAMKVGQNLRAYLKGIPNEDILDIRNKTRWAVETFLDTYPLDDDHDTITKYYLKLREEEDQ